MRSQKGTGQLHFCSKSLFGKAATGFLFLHVAHYNIPLHALEGIRHPGLSREASQEVYWLLHMGYHNYG
jgi:hypothetical protein